MALAHAELRALLVDSATFAASDELDAITRDLPRGLPHPDGVQRIRTHPKKRGGSHAPGVRDKTRVCFLGERHTAGMEGMQQSDFGSLCCALWWKVAFHLIPTVGQSTSGASAKKIRLTLALHREEHGC